MWRCAKAVRRRISFWKQGRVAGVRGRDGDGKEFSARARIVIDAGGRNCLSIRRFKLRKNRRPGAKIALAAHWKGVTALKDYCHMHISEPGYTGMAPTGKDEANIVLVVGRECLKGEDLHAFYVRTVLKNPLRSRLLEGGAVAEKARTVDSTGICGASSQSRRVDSGGRRDRVHRPVHRRGNLSFVAQRADRRGGVAGGVCSGGFFAPSAHALRLAQASGVRPQVSVETGFCRR